MSKSRGIEEWCQVRLASEGAQRVVQVIEDNEWRRLADCSTSDLDEAYDALCTCVYFRCPQHGGYRVDRDRLLGLVEERQAEEIQLEMVDLLD